MTGRDDGISGRDDAISGRDDGGVGLDDLLRPGQTAPRPPWAESVRAWFMPVLQTFSASVIIYAFLYVASFPLPYVLIATVCLAGLLIRQAVVAIAEHPRLRTGDVVRPFQSRPSYQTGPFVAGGDGMLEAIRRWDRDLTWGFVGGNRFAFTVGRRIGEIVDERLRQRYGITRATDPARARELMGENLWYLTGPLQRVPTYRQVTAALADLERI